jgi:nitrite reductase/ring-hydroxylating ferredoxin subunit
MSWTRVAALADFGGRQVMGVACGGTRLALYHLADGVFATSDRCPHAGAPLSRGCVVERFIECPVHFSLFDIRTGAADGGTTTTKLRTVPVKVAQDEIYVDLTGFEETTS